MIPDVELYTPLGWPLRGWNAVGAFVEQFHVLLGFRC